MERQHSSKVSKCRFESYQPRQSGFGEMDIISGFEPEGVGSIPAGPAKIFLQFSQKGVDL